MFHPEKASQLSWSLQWFSYLLCLILHLPGNLAHTKGKAMTTAHTLRTPQRTINFAKVLGENKEFIHLFQMFSNKRFACCLLMSFLLFDILYITSCVYSVTQAPKCIGHNGLWCFLFCLIRKHVSLLSSFLFAFFHKKMGVLPLFSSMSISEVMNGKTPRIDPQ